MMTKTITVTVNIPEYLYKAAETATASGLFRDMSELVNAGLRHELDLVQRLLPAENLSLTESQDWQTRLNHLRLLVWQKQQASGQALPKEEEVIEELRATRRAFCENTYHLDDSLNP